MHNEDTYLIAVYGSLKAGRGNHIVIDHPTTRFVGEEIIFGPYKMISCGSYPAVCRRFDGKQDTVHLEVYEVNSTTLKQVDWLEGYDSRNLREYNHYQREVIETIYGPALWYLQEWHECEDAPAVVGGNW